MNVLNQMYMHVKWFVGHERETPMAMTEVVGGPFLLWMAVTMVGLLLSAIYNERLQQIGMIQRIHTLLDRAKPHISTILRVGLGIALLLQLFAGSFLAPELDAQEWWLTALVVIALAGLFTQRTLAVSGAAIAILYAVAMLRYGLFHALDYGFYLGIIYYLLVFRSQLLRPTATPVLYLFTGLSLAWVAMEKFTMPELAVHIVEEFHIPTFGFSIEHFVLISAFIEVGLAWTFIVGILNRFVSIIVTLVFITTTTVFGFTEIVGHTILHTLLIMFLIEGEGTFTTPFHFHRKPLLRYLFVLVNFIVLLFGMMWLYIVMGGH
jgi:hypothetical protein